MSPFSQTTSGFVGSARLSFEDRWIQVSVSLGPEYSKSDLVQLADGVETSIKPMDALAATYVQRNWFSGFHSGVFYAFRTLALPRRKVRILELSGQLCSIDMTALASAAALAVSRAAQRELPADDLEGWSADSGTFHEIQPSSTDRVIVAGAPVRSVEIHGVMTANGEIIVSSHPFLDTAAGTLAVGGQPEPDTADVE